MPQKQTNPIAEAKGRPGKEVYNMALDLIKNYKK